MSQSIEADLEEGTHGAAGNNAAKQNASNGLGSMQGTAQPAAGGLGADLAGIWRDSAHPVALLFLYLFRSLAIAVYLLCGFFSNSYVLSTVLVVLLLSADFWTVRNVSGRVLVGLRYWNQVDDDGSSYWVFESRDPSQPANAVDSKMFWMAMYIFPAAWIVLFFVGLLKFNVSFLPIVALALVFNVTNTVAFTYADRDAKKRWATGMATQGMMSGVLGSAGTSIVGGLARGAMGKMFSG